MPRTGSPLKEEWAELENEVRDFFLLLARQDTDSIGEQMGFARVIAAINFMICHASTLNNGQPCSDFDALKSIKEELEKEHPRLNDPLVREEILERIRREQQDYRRATRLPAV